LEACAIGSDVEEEACEWKTVLPRTKLQAHTRHFFADEVTDVGAVSHVRFNIFPDGGVSRLRVYGKIE
jgi:allantoicase